MKRVQRTVVEGSQLSDFHQNSELIWKESVVGDDLSTNNDHPLDGVFGSQHTLKEKKHS